LCCSRRREGVMGMPEHKVIVYTTPT